jgi:hypothetical protein
VDEYSRFGAPFDCDGLPVTKGPAGLADMGSVQSGPGNQGSGSGVNSSVQKNSNYGQNSDKIYGRKKMFDSCIFCQHYGRKFCRNFV